MFTAAFVKHLFAHVLNDVTTEKKKRHQSNRAKCQQQKYVLDASGHFFPFVDNLVNVFCFERFLVSFLEVRFQQSNQFTHHTMLMTWNGCGGRVHLLLKWMENWVIQYCNPREMQKYCYHVQKNFIFLENHLFLVSQQNWKVWDEENSFQPIWCLKLSLK